MTLRTLDYRIWPVGTPLPAGVAATGIDRGILTFDTDQVAREAMRELLQSAPSNLGMLNTIEDLLVAGNASLLWRERGPGIGSEMRRGFSALFGRFFARAYLSHFHNFTRFVPLDRSPALVRPNVRVRVVGNNRNLPDWIAVGHGQFVLGEAKGAYLDRPSYQNRMPMPARLEAAKDQLEQVAVEIRRPSGSWSPIRTKGWGVLSRWGSVGSGQPPHLCVVDPWTEGDEATPDDVRIITEAVASQHTAMILKGLGYGTLAQRVAPTDEETSATADLHNVAVSVGDDDRKFIGTVVGPTGPLPGDPDVLRPLIEALPYQLAKHFFFVGVWESQLSEMIEGKFVDRGDGERVGSSGFIERDGTLIVPLQEARQVSPVKL